MKKTVYRSLAIILTTMFVLMGCFKAAPKSQEDSKNSQETTKSQKKNAEIRIPAIISAETAGCYEGPENEALNWVMSLERFDTITILGPEKERKYVASGKSREGKFYFCEVSVGDEMKNYWILSLNLEPNGILGTVTSDCLLYSKPSAEKIIANKKVTRATLVIAYEDFVSTEFYKIKIPEDSNKIFYIANRDLSIKDADITVTKLYQAAKSFDDSQKDAKTQLLQSAAKSYPFSALSDLIDAELNRILTLTNEPEISNSEEAGTDDATPAENFED